MLRGLVEAGPAFAAERPYLPAIVAEMLERGTRSHDRIAIEERLERAGIRRGYFVDDDPTQNYNALALRFAASCAADDLPTLLETLAEELREPAFEQREFELVKSESLGALRLLRTHTNWRAMQRFLQLAYEPGDVNAEPELDTLLAGIEALSLDDVRRYYASTIVGAPALLSAAGAVPATAFDELATEALGALPVRPIDAMSRPPGVRVRPAREIRENVELERKTSVDVVIGRATSLVRRDDSYLAATVANGILGQSTLSSRLGLQLRDREGLTYGITSGFLGAGRLPGPWRIGVTVNPANVERAVTSARAVLRAYAHDGPTPRELDQQRNSMSGAHRVALGTNGGIAAARTHHVLCARRRLHRYLSGAACRHFDNRCACGDRGAPRRTQSHRRCCRNAQGPISSGWYDVTRGRMQTPASWRSQGRSHDAASSPCGTCRSNVTQTRFPMPASGTTETRRASSEMMYNPRPLSAYSSSGRRTSSAKAGVVSCTEI